MSESGFASEAFALAFAELLNYLKSHFEIGIPRCYVQSKGRGSANKKERRSRYLMYATENPNSSRFIFYSIQENCIEALQSFMSSSSYTSPQPSTFFWGDESRLVIATSATHRSPIVVS